MASIVTQSDRTVEVLTQIWSKMGPKWTQNGSKMGPKMDPNWVQKGVPKWVPQRSEPKKKVEKYFFSGPTTGGYRGPRSKNTILGRHCLSRPCCRRFSEKSAVPPRRMVQRGGGEPHFFSKICDSMVWIGNTLLKNWSKRGVPPFWALFGDFGDFR